MVLPKEVENYRVHLEENGLKPQSVSHMLSDCRCFFGWAERNKHVDRSPFPKGVMPRVQERPPDRLSEEEGRETRVFS